MSDLVTRLRAQLAKGRENALLHLSLAQALLGEDATAALQHAERAIALDAQYSAAWKAKGKALEALAQRAEAAAAWRQGISIAESRGDAQAAREMRVFLRRVEAG